MSKMVLDDYSLTECLGKGAFGEVYLTSKIGSSQKFATKKLEKKINSNPKLKKYFDNEVAILKECNHENIVKLYELKETTNYFFLVMELCNGGELSSYLEYNIKKYKKPLNEEIVQHLMRQIVSAIKYLHNRRILHRDLKLENILVHFDNDADKKAHNLMKAQVKLIDFGFARKIEKEELAYSVLGSPVNMDPGILKKMNKIKNYESYGYDEKADIWSLGTLCYELLVGKMTFDANSMNELLSKVTKGDYNLPTFLSKESISFINGMLQYDKKKRLSADQLIEHPFLIRDYQDFHRVDLQKAKNKIQRNKIQINAMVNSSIWVFVDPDGQLGLADFQNNPVKNVVVKPKEKIIPVDNTDNRKLSDEEIKKEMLNALIFINNDYIFVEPKLIPVIPGDDPTVIDKYSQYRED